MKKLAVDCSDSKSTACSDRLTQIQNCSAPLIKEDCKLMPGYLSIFFRAKLMQAEAKYSLTSVAAAEKVLKEDPKMKKYSFDMVHVLKDYKPLSHYNYVFGFMKACSPHAKTNSLEIFPGSYTALDSKAKSNIRNYFVKGKKGDCYDPALGFEAFAVGVLDPLHPHRLDVWKINHDMNLLQVEDGLPIP